MTIIVVFHIAKGTLLYADQLNFNINSNAHQIVWSIAIYNQ